MSRWIEIRAALISTVLIVVVPPALTLPRIRQDAQRRAEFARINAPAERELEARRAQRQRDREMCEAMGGKWEDRRCHSTLKP